MKNVPKVLFEKDMPQLGAQAQIAPRVDLAFFGTMFLVAMILTFISWFVLETMFGEDFMQG